MSPAVGFDLDMTLVDTRPGIHEALLAFAAETGRPIDVNLIVANLGPPVAEALSPWFTVEEMPDAVARFRAHMTRVGVFNVIALPGAADAIAAARELGLRVLVVTAKIERLAVETLRHAGLSVDEVAGNVWSAGKAVPLRAAAALAYVGDHPHDMHAATLAGIPAVGVPSGAATAAQLTAAGATTVLDDLRAFPGWLAAAALSA